jgi:hypothetical protein
MKIIDRATGIGSTDKKLGLDGLDLLDGGGG